MINLLDINILGSKIDNFQGKTQKAKAEQQNAAWFLT